MQDFGIQNFVSSEEAILAEVESELQKATIEWFGYVDSESREVRNACC